MKKLNIAYFGAPAFSASVLEHILTDATLPVSLRSVVTQPDRPVGRKQVLTPTSVKLLAQKYNLPVFEKLQEVSSKLQEVDLVLLYAYGKIIPSEMLKMPRWGFWNIHPSLLPLYRGASPIVYPLLLNDKKTGVSLIEMDSRMDHGTIIVQEETDISPTETQEELRIRLSDIGYKLFKESIQVLISGSLQKKEQNHVNATYTRLLTKQDGFLPFTTVQKILQGITLPNEEAPPLILEYYQKNPSLFTNHYSLSPYYSLYRALSPWPGIWTLLPNGKRLKITRMELKKDLPHITHVQLEGKKEVEIKTFLSAYSFTN